MKGWSLVKGAMRGGLVKFLTRLAAGGIAIVVSTGANAQGACPNPEGRMVTANVVALDMPLMFNRLGAQNINGMMYALKRDVVSLRDDFKVDAAGNLVPGQDYLPDNIPLTVLEQQYGKTIDGSYAGKVALRPDKRPRPLVLRTGTGDCLTINLTNLLHTPANPFNPANGPVERSNVDFRVHNDNQVAGRRVSLRFQGTELVGTIDSDGTHVGKNSDSTILPGQSTTYTVYTPYDGAYLGVSYGAKTGGEGQGGTDASGLWAVLNVNPKHSVFYRSAVTNEELLLSLDTSGTVKDGDGYAADADADGYIDTTGQPVIDYEATYPYEEPWLSEGKAGLPIINMIQNGEMVHTAIDAIVAYGPNFELEVATTDVAEGHEGLLGHFPKTIYPLESNNYRNPTVPNRLEPFRELTVAFHDETQTTQVFPKWYNDPVLGHTLHGVRDSFMINYGSGGIGSEIIANRLGVGPMHDCVNCAYEEFFLTFGAVGEVGQVVDIPANMGLEDCDPTLANCGANGPKANYVLYPDDPSNVHHGYVGDATAFRNLHAGPGEQHVFHLHNHQWLFNADDDNSNYIDAQGLGPGSGYGYWINFGGSGNRNKTAGDAIFHCHFYPHFAQGMWEMWRIHDAFEPGTTLQVSVDGGGVHESFVTDGLGVGNGLPAINDPNNRALPDGEIVAGAPQPAVIPLPGKPLPPMPAMGVGVKPNDNFVQVCADGDGNQVLRNADGSCPNTDEFGDPLTIARAVGSLTDVDRSTVFLPGGEVKNPGYPFWIAGMEHTVGSRPPTPPLDMITKAQADSLVASGDPLWQHMGWGDANAIDGWDGGLPRFSVEGYSAGGEAAVAITRLDMSKEIHVAKPVFFPEEGTDLEQVAMAYHATRCHDTASLQEDAYGNLTVVYRDCEADPNVPTLAGMGLSGNVTRGGFLTNGGLPIAGAPFQDPCLDDRGVFMDSERDGRFFGGTLKPMWDTSNEALSTVGRSPYDSATPRVYKGANVQFDAVLNKLGYHFPQQRIISLWQDVVPTIKQERPPEPFVLRMNTFDCTQYLHSNVVPKAYELDDYQVRTPTDIIGQHIHLPKWDLTSADGSANGWNYEDGTLSPEAVIEMIHAINNWNVHARDDGDAATVPVTEVFFSPTVSRPVVDSAGNALGGGVIELSDDVPHPFFGLTEYAAKWVGARSTIQRWFADPVVNVQGVDRGLGIIFTHDHYGPSTHQQVGLYATVLVEPAGSEWKHNETGTDLYTRTSSPDPALNDGGPTSWQAAILTNRDTRYNMAGVKADKIAPFREFYFEYTDFQHAYQPGVFVGMTADQQRIDPFGTVGVKYDGTDADHDGLIDNPIMAADPDTFREAIQPSVRKQASLKNGFPLDIWEFPPVCTGNVILPDGTNSAPRPCPEAISADDPGMYVVNYRNESLLARIFDPDRPGPDAPPGQDCSNPDNRTGCGMQAEGRAGDLAFAMDSNVTRAIGALNSVQGLAPASYFDSTACSNGAGGSVFCPPINNPQALSGGDPFTPMMRVMDADHVAVKMQAGGQEEEHSATVHGLSWLQGGSAHGEAKNSGWRNSQAAGISEQFSLKMPIFADYNQRGNQADYAYSFNPAIDGWSTGTWGILRSYKGGGTSGLYQLESNEFIVQDIRVGNARDFNGVCPKNAPTRSYDLTAVSVNDVLRSADGVTIQDWFPNSHVGGTPDANGGTLVYNPRQTLVNAGDSADVGGTRGGYGPLHDPTGIIYVHTSDLISAVEAAYLADSSKPASSPENDPYCWRAPLKGNKWKYDPSLPACQRALHPDAPIEPVVIRAAAGECLDVKLNNQVLAQAYDDRDNDGYYDHLSGDYLLFQADGRPAYEDKRGKGPQYELSADTDYDGVGDTPPAGTVRFDETLDLANGNALAAVVRRDPGQGAEGLTFFNNNLIQPSAYVGLHPQLVEFDVTRSDGVNVGQNPATQAVQPGSQQTYTWYAGKVDMRIQAGKGNKLEGTLVATPVEFGGFNISPTDPIKQGQKGLVAAGAVYPAGSSWTVDAGGHTSATVTRTDGYGPAFRDFTTVASKGVHMVYGDSWPIENLLGEGTFGVAEDAQDMGHMNINFGNEAMWFRFGVNPTMASGNAKCNGAVPGDPPCMGGLDSNTASQAYANSLTGGDPETAVFTADAGQQFRMHVLMPFGPGRGSTYDLHGHVWQRDPYLCHGDSEFGLYGKCNMGTGDLAGVPGQGAVGSQHIGENPQGFHLGGIESWFPSEHYEIFIPSAGGTWGVAGDYLFRDHMGLGNSGGLWGIVRVGGAGGD